MSEIENLRIERIIADLYNDGSIDMLASTTFNSSTPILPRASDYEAIVEFASIDLTNLVLDVAPDYEIMILNDEGDRAGNRFPELPNYVNVFRFPGELREVKQLDLWLYQITHKKSLPETLGTLSITKNGYFRRAVSAEEFNKSFASGLFKVYVNDGLRRVIPELVMQEENMMVKGKSWWGLNSNIQDTTQVVDTLPQLLKADSIRFYSTLPTNPYIAQSRAMGELVRENVLTTMAINNETTNILHKTSKRYEPNVYRRFSLVNDQPVTNFMVWAMVHYSHGRTVMHTLSPGDYMNLLISFEPRR